MTQMTQIDKAFRIAKPMRKASWTRRFAAGWGERRREPGDRSAPGSFDKHRPAKNEEELALDARTVRRSAVFIASKTRCNRVRIGSG